MYQIFLNEQIITLYSNTETDCPKSALQIESTHDFRNALNLIFNSDDNFDLQGKDNEFLLNLFKTELQFIEAAGGVVTNEHNEVLFIHRLGVWDLPKGKIEDGESPETAAIREIAEECGIEGHQLKEKITDTYHIYERDGKTYLKKTYWYLFELEDSDKQELSPQTEEDIEQVVWLDSDEAELALMDTYKSIELVYERFFEL